MSDKKIKEAIDQYVAARKRLLDLGERYPKRIGGNDNLIGRIGEFVALRFLESFGRSPQKEESSVNSGFDLKGGSPEVRTQVKVISSENVHGRTVRLRKGWDELLLIELDDNYEPVRIGLLTKEQQKKAIAANPRWSWTPIVKLSMLGSKGLIKRYGKVYEKEEIQRRLG